MNIPSEYINSIRRISTPKNGKVCNMSVQTSLDKPSQLLVTVNNNPRQRRYDDSWKLLTLADLEENSVVNSKKTILVCRTLYIKRASASEKSTGLAYISRSYRGGGGSQGNLNYERMLVVMIPNAPAGNNIAVFLLGNGQNSTFWDANLDKRDTNDFSKYLLLYGRLFEGMHCIYVMNLIINVCSFPFT